MPIMVVNLVYKKLCQLLLKLTSENSKLITRVALKVLLVNHHHSKNKINNKCLVNLLKEQDQSLKRKTQMMAHGALVMNLLNIKLLQWRLILHLIKELQSSLQHIKQFTTSQSMLLQEKHMVKLEESHLCNKCNSHNKFSHQIFTCTIRLVIRTL